MLHRMKMCGTDITFPKEAYFTLTLGVQNPRVGLRMVLTILNSFMLHDPRIWGEDVTKFDPSRFLSDDSKGSELPDPTNILFGFGRRYGNAFISLNISSPQIQ